MWFASGLGHRDKPINRAEDQKPAADHAARIFAGPVENLRDFFIPSSSEEETVRESLRLKRTTESIISPQRMQRAMAISPSSVKTQSATIIP